MSDKPFGGIEETSLVDETPLDTGQTELIFTRDELDAMSNTMIRRLASELETDEIHGKRPRFVITTALARQKSLTEYEEE